MLNPAFDDIRDCLVPHIMGLLPDMPNKDVISGLSADDLNNLWSTEKQRLMDLMSNLEKFLNTLEDNAQAQISQTIPLVFASNPKGSFGLYMDN